MKIVLFTNTYLPHVGGVARSVNTLEEACRARGHEVRVIAPEFEDSESTENVLRVPAIQHFNGSDFSVRIPILDGIGDFVDSFKPDIVHSHHPFLLGDAALRVARKYDLPVLFTHHTLYERYTHYVPLDSPALKRVAIQLATEYCNLCDTIIAPSESIAILLRERGVEKNIVTIPTGIDLALFANGNREEFRRKEDISPDAKVIGVVGRLAKEKNLLFLAEAVGLCMKENRQVIFLLVGEGDAKDEILGQLQACAHPDQIKSVGKLTSKDLADAYAAMDVFVFASQTETQGIVLAEAMAAGKPVIALDGPGVREILRDGTNGRMLDSTATAVEFAEAIKAFLSDEKLMHDCVTGAVTTAADYGIAPCTDRMLACYEVLLEQRMRQSDHELSGWDKFMNSVESEWDLLTAKIHALSAVRADSEEKEAALDK